MKRAYVRDIPIRDTRRFLVTPMGVPIACGLKRGGKDCGGVAVTFAERPGKDDVAVCDRHRLMVLARNACREHGGYVP